MAQTRSAAVSFVCKFTRFVVEMRGQRVSQTCSNKLSPLVLISLCVYMFVYVRVCSHYSHLKMFRDSLYFTFVLHAFTVFFVLVAVSLSVSECGSVCCAYRLASYGLSTHSANLFPLWRCSDKTEQRTVTCRARRTAEFLFLWPLHFFFSTNSNKGDFSTL